MWFINVYNGSSLAFVFFLTLPYMFQKDMKYHAIGLSTHRDDRLNAQGHRMTPWGVEVARAHGQQFRAELQTGASASAGVVSL